MANVHKGPVSLVTGGAGFLGSHLCERLLREGHRVICVDDLSTGRLENIETLGRDGHFEFVRHDIRDPIDLPADKIFNLACPASPPAYQADPIKTTMTSVLGVRNLLELARAHGARLIQASSSEVYGDPVVNPQPESYRGNVSTTGPRACYDEGKRCAETLIFDYRRIYRVDSRVARIFNTYGPRMREDDGRIVSNFVVEALCGRELTVYGDGSHTRSMCYVDDLIDGLLLLSESTADPGTPVNLGNPHEMTILEFAHRVLALTGSSAKISYQREPVDDPHLRCPDISLARTFLKWEPRVSLDTGLRNTIIYFRHRISAELGRS